MFSGAALHPVLLTHRFSEVHSRVYYHNRFSGLLVDSQKTAEAVGPRSSVVNTHLKQGVMRSQSTLNYIQTRFRLEALPTQASLRACRTDEHPG